MQVVERSSLVSLLFTPHAQRERGKVIGRGVHIYIFSEAFSHPYISFFHLLVNGCFVIIGERAKRVRHSQVCTIENRGYIYYGTCNFSL